jgi:hypothetical protein
MSYLVCKANVGAGFGMRPNYGVCIFSECSERDFGSGSYCSSGCPCGHGGGDCDSDGQCMPGMSCEDDIGPAFDMSAATDVCIPDACRGRTLFANDFCSAECPCGHGGGDCDSNAECMPGLTCGTDNGPAFGLPSSWDVCVRP